MAKRPQNSSTDATHIFADGKHVGIGSPLPVALSPATAASSVAISNVTTSATGANWVQLPLVPFAVDVINLTGVTIEYQRGITGDTMHIPTGSSRMIVGISDSQDIRFRRVDQDNAQVIIRTEVFS